MRKETGSATIALVLILIAVAAVVIYLVHNLSGVPSGYSNISTSPSSSTGNMAGQVPKVNNPQDLMTVSNDLDNTNIDSLNQGLNQNDADSANF